MPASIFNGTAVKILKNILRFKDGTEISSTQAGNLVSNAGTSTDNALAKFDLATGKVIQNSGAILDDSNNISGLGTINTHTLPAGTDTIALLDATQTFTNKTLTTPLITTNGSIDVTAAGTLSIAASAGANNVTIAGSTSTVVIPGNLQVDGTLTKVNTTNLDVTDANITVNDGGNQATADAQVAGFTVEMSDATDALFGYDSTLTSKFKCGESGSLIEIATVSHTQTLTNKTLTLPNVNEAVNLTATSTELNQLDGVSVGGSTSGDIVTIDGTQTLTNKTLTSPNVNEAVALTATATELNQLDGVSVGGNTAGDIVTIDDTQTLTNKTIDADLNSISNIDNADIKAAAAIDVNKLAAVTANRALTSDGSGFITVSSVTDTELGYVSGVTSNIQTQIDSKIGVNAIFDITSSSGTFTATANATHLVSTAAVATVTLPAAATDVFVRIKDSTGNANSNNITVNTPGAETIDGAANDVIDSDYASVVYVSNGTNWFKL